MALFGITRYMGDDPEVDDFEPDSQADLILQKLNQQAKQAKKSTPKNSSLSQPQTPSSARKKRKHPAGLDVNEDSELNCGLVKKKKINETPEKGNKISQIDRGHRDTETNNNEFDSKIQKSEAKVRKKGIKDLQNKTLSPSSKDQEVNPDDDELEERFIEDEKIISDTTTGQQHEEIGGFTVIGDVKQRDIHKVHRVLPEWLANPSVISADIRNKKIPISKCLGLEEDILNTLHDNKVTHFFPVQSQVIPVLLDSVKTGFMYGQAGFRPQDICCSAPTGSGKTLAFVLPIVQALRQRVTCEVRALAVLPVRDLATQVYKVFQTYCKNTSLKVGLLIGQKTFASEQHSIVRKGLRGHQSLVDIIVATPGRLVDHINQTEGFSLGQLRFLVIDEADRMMEDVKQDWLTQVERAVYKHRKQPEILSAATACKLEIPLQKLLFSATLSQNPEKLQQLNLFMPRLFTSVVQDTTKQKSFKEDGSQITSSTQAEFVGKYTTPTGLTEFYVQASLQDKPLLVLYFLHHRKFRHVLCFTNSVEATHRLYHLVRLVGGIEVREFSSRMHAIKRNKILTQFAAGKIDLLICTDAMSRGMDVENVQYVISYEPAYQLKTYIHRIGRTARAGKVGTAFTLLEKKQIFHFKKLLKEAGKTDLKELVVNESDLSPLIPQLQEALKELEDVLKGEKMLQNKNKR